MKILFFLESLRSGGKERRLLELISFLKENTNYEICVVITEPDIHYQYVFDLGIPIIIMKRLLLRKDPSIFFRFFYICLKYKPNIIHSWAGMTTFYSIPTSLLLKIPIITNEITDATPAEYKKSYSKLIWKINSLFVKRIISNSYAGLNAYNVTGKKGLVIHNGIRMERFQNLSSEETLKRQLNINKKYIVAMVASFEYNKDFRSFIKLARKMSELRNDITFLAIGGGTDLEVLKNEVSINGPSSLLFTGRLKSVEPIISICDIGILLTNKSTHGEGIPNSVMEFMALRKPVIATNAGGTNELIIHNVSGFLVDNNDPEPITKMINFLLENGNRSHEMGEEGYKTITEKFPLKKMGVSFLKVYNEFLNNQK